MKKVYMAVLAVSMLACNSAPKQEEAAQSTEKTQEGQFFGEKITAEGAQSAVEVARSLKENDTLSVKMSGKVAAVCQNKGCWMKIEAGNDTTMRVSFKDYAFFVPKDCAGKTAIVDGIAYVQVTTVEELKHYAKDAGKSKTEIEAIKEPEKELVFEAKGVILQ